MEMVALEKQTKDQVLGDLVAVRYGLDPATYIEEAQFNDVDAYDSGLIWRRPTRDLYSVSGVRVWGNVRFRIVPWHAGQTIEDLRDEMRERHLRATVMAETLTFARVYSRIQSRCMILGLGSIYEDSAHQENILCLSGFRVPRPVEAVVNEWKRSQEGDSNHRSRCLSLVDQQHFWGKDCCYALAVPM